MKNWTRYAALTGAAALLSAIALAAGAETREEMMAAHRGGEMRFVAAAAGGTIDPQINYTLQYWQLFYLSYDGLVTFRRVEGAGAGEVVPDLAEAMPEVSADGLTYTFKLRQEIGRAHV